MKNGCYFVAESIQTDVLVVGGGTAGVFAALGAKNAGSDTILIEKNTILGGTMTQAKVCFPGLFHAWGRQIIGGYGFEAVKRTLKFEQRDLPVFPYRSKYHFEQQIALNEFFFATVLDEMCCESGVKVMLGVAFFDAEETENGVDIYAAWKDGILQIHAKRVIDASGDACIVRKCGYPVSRSDRVQPASLRARFDGYEPSALDRAEVLQKAEEAIQSGRLSHCVDANLVWNCVKNKSSNPFHIDGSFADTGNGYSQLQMQARGEVLRLLQFIRSIKGCEHATVKRFAVACGVRETVRIRGEYEITVDDYLNGVIFDDAICFAFYPIDLHTASPSAGTKENLYNLFLKDGVVPTVPYRALIPKNSKRILCAGRTISSDQLANSALRVQATCMAVGQAAGVAASLSAQKNIPVGEILYADLRDVLKAQGAILPEK